MVWEMAPNSYKQISGKEFVCVRSLQGNGDATQNQIISKICCFPYLVVLDPQIFNDLP